MAKFIREIPKNKLKTTEINDLTQYGFTIVDKADSIEVWAETDEKVEA